MKLTDDELDTKLRELTAEKEARDARKREAECAAKLARLKYLQVVFTPKVIDALALEHRKGRYGNVCSDQNPSGACRTASEPKDYNCDRCRLLEFVNLRDEDALQESDVQVHVVFG